MLWLLLLLKVERERSKKQTVNQTNFLAFSKNREMSSVSYILISQWLLNIGNIGNLREFEKFAALESSGNCCWEECEECVQQKTKKKFYPHSDPREMEEVGKVMEMEEGIKRMELLCTEEEEEEIVCYRKMCRKRIRSVEYRYNRQN